MWAHMGCMEGVQGRSRGNKYRIPGRGRLERAAVGGHLGGQKDPGLYSSNMEATGGFRMGESCDHLRLRGKVEEKSHWGSAGGIQ